MASKRTRSASEDEAKDDGPAYLAGFGNEFSSEAIAGALPKGQNNPQVVRTVGCGS